MPLVQARSTERLDENTRRHIACRLRASDRTGAWAVIDRLSLAWQPGRRFDIVDASGVASHAASTAGPDGRRAPIKDSLEADTVALKLPAPNVLVMDLVKGGVPASTRVYTVAADGKTLI